MQKEIHQIELEQAEGEYAVCRLAPNAAIPAWADGTGFVTISRSAHELSIVCLAERVPEDMQKEGGWTCLRFVGPFAFGATGIVLSVVRPLSEGGLGVFVVSTFDGDHLLLKRGDMPKAVALLGQAGHVLTPVDGADSGSHQV
ncbi:ACT domain-containing protein [Massilia dura]|uniref:ACT domain-containing protein n=1 Tax=Pseudoduganella dura TaxID=321982 RepID=A0A6I3XD73_9BURK|nr:ACT domain-containing protein [Pseudoduganella dura]MUI14459.1 ACT domain-containing protein [Pseudoduganella dura]GGY07957.1 ACT domain-containing protein [Pseudoduganella dura]